MWLNIHLLQQSLKVQQLHMSLPIVVVYLLQLQLLFVMNLAQTEVLQL